MPKVASIPGDGIGPEVVSAALNVAESACNFAGIDLEVEQFDMNADRYLRDGVGMTDAEFERLRDDFDAIFLGALGDPRIPDMAHGKEILLGLRFGLDLYVNLRPVRLLEASLCPLKGRGSDDVDFVVVRENTEGAYAGVGGAIKRGTAEEVATQEMINTHKGVERIVRYAFEYAERFDRHAVCMTDKHNVLTDGHGLWKRVFESVADDHPEIEARHLFADALAMEMVRDPSQFEVIVTCNMFGDILSDLGAQIQGGMGVAPSGNLNPRTGHALFEPVHGSAPDIAGEGRANPIAAIRSVAMLFDHLGYEAVGAAVERAVAEAVAARKVSPDLNGELSTSEVGEAVIERLNTDQDAG